MQQSFVFAFTPIADISPIDAELNLGCGGTTAPVQIGINTLLLSASTSPVPDIVALAATQGNDGIVNISPSTGTGVFAVATVNVGAPDTITARADTAGAVLPVTLQLCETNPATGVCLAAPTSSVTRSIPAGSHAHLRDLRDRHRVRPLRSRRQSHLRAIHGRGRGHAGLDQRGRPDSRVRAPVSVASTRRPALARTLSRSGAAELGIPSVMRIEAAKSLNRKLR